MGRVSTRKPLLVLVSPLNLTVLTYRAIHIYCVIHAFWETHLAKIPHHDQSVNTGRSYQNNWQIRRG